MSHKKFGPNRFSRFDVYWIQTNKQTPKQTNKQHNKQKNKQTDKPNLYIDDTADKKTCLQFKRTRTLRKNAIKFRTVLSKVSSFESNPYQNPNIEL